MYFFTKKDRVFSIQKIIHYVTKSNLNWTLKATLNMMQIQPDLKHKHYQGLNQTRQTRPHKTNSVDSCAVTIDAKARHATSHLEFRQLDYLTR